MYYIYCDESCHLPNDISDVMVLGAMTCPMELKSQIFREIRDIKKKHNLSTWFEVKWTKVSESKIDFYRDLITYFFTNENLSFRGVVARQKRLLDHKKHNNDDYNVWYYKMCYLLLNPLIDPGEKYRIFIDIKDTLGGPRVNKLHEVLCNNIYDFKHDVITDINQINSRESEILQLADLLIGTLSYYHRGLNNSPTANEGKKILTRHLTETYNIDISRMTKKTERKFNLFIWDPEVL